MDVGEHLAGYRIEAVAGTGATATVYKATQLAFERLVALKVVSTTTAIQSDTVRERIRRASRHASALEHDHIIPVFEAGEAGTWMFVAMLLVDGPTLADRIDSGELTPRETLRVLRPIASALDRAHEARLVHGDIKPSNVLLRADGHPYLTDFGMTSGAGAGPPDLTGAAARSYAAPEQLEGRQVTVASDVYSLTAVLVECLGGAATQIEEVAAHGMARRPSKRFRTAGELIAACEVAFEALGDATLDRPAGPHPEVVRRWEPASARTPAATSSPAPEAAPAPDPEPAPAIAKPLPAPPVHERPEPATPRPRDGDGGTGVRPQRTARTLRRPAAPSSPSVPRLRRDRSSPVRQPSRRLGRPLTILAIVGAVLAPLLLGYALGGGGESAAPPPQAPKRAESASVTLTVPPGWRPAAVAFDELELVAPIGLRDGAGVELATGRLRDPASGLDPIRASTRATIANPSKDVVRIADRSALRYTGEQPDGGAVWLVLLPDTSGWTVVACRAPGSPNLDAICGRVAGLLTPVDATPVELAPDSGLGETLRAELADLSKARSAAHDPLRANSPTVRGRAAAALAEATLSASDGLDDAEVRVQDRTLVAALVTALAGEAKALERLSSAARRNDRPAYKRRRTAVRRAERATADALRALRRGGYDVTVKRT